MKKLLVLILALIVSFGACAKINEISLNKENGKEVLVSSERCQAITKKGTQCKRKAAEGSNYCWQHGGKTKSNSGSKIKQTSSGETYHGKTIQTGPRGGKYYINKNGNKTYVKRR